MTTLQNELIQAHLMEIHEAAQSICKACIGAATATAQLEHYKDDPNHTEKWAKDHESREALYTCISCLVAGLDGICNNETLKTLEDKEGEE